VHVPPDIPVLALHREMDPDDALVAMRDFLAGSGLRPAG
jgi:hypothetical protein